MRSKSDAARGTAARFAELAAEADDYEEREYYSRQRDAWITLAKRCEPFILPDVTEK
jgi:dihydrodipicolinate reductase